MKPWRSIEVGPYVPVIKWAIEKTYEWVAARTGEPIWEVEKEELDSLPIQEAVQKCLYDLRLSRFTENPYFALLAGIVSLSGIKLIAIKVAKELKRMEELEAQRTGHRREGRHRPTAQERDSGSAPQTTDSRMQSDGTPSNPRQGPVPFRRPQQDRQSRQATSTALSTVNGRTGESEAGYSYVDSPTQGNPTYLLNEFDQLDE
jgi:hypothetical protein